ncbi:MAG: hypothetical protein RL365_220 [Bacteroidota bacterium]
MKMLLLYLFTVTLLNVWSQIIIDHSDLPSVGDYIPRRADTMTVIPGPGGSGPNQTWNFTALSNYVITENTNIVSVATTPNGNQFGASNLAMTNDNANYLYFNKSAQSFTTQGYSGDLLGTGTINAQFAPDLTLHQFPRTFGTSFSDSYVIDVTVPGAAINPLINQIHFKRNSIVKDTTDAWGLITTPFGSYDVLRIHTMETYIDSIWAQPLFPPTWSLVSTSADTTHSYSWVGKGGKLAIAEMSFDTLGLPKIFKWTEMQGIAVGLTENEKSEIKITPNPTSSSGIVTIQSCEIGEKFTLVNTLGKVVMEGCILTKPLELNLNNLNQGLYILTLGGKQARVIKQ